MKFPSSKDIARGAFSHPDFGPGVTLEHQGKEVRLTIICHDEARARAFADNLLAQLKGGKMQLTLAGKPSSIKEEWK